MAEQKKFAVIRTNSSCLYADYAEAEKIAKKSVSQNQEDYVILAAIALASAPIPEIVVTKL
jgi:hypothetical protein